MEGTSGQDLARLVECFRAAGAPYAGHGADPVDLDREDGIWLVERGSVDVFVTQTEGGRHAAPLKHLLRAESGELLFGAAPAESGRLRLRAKVVPDTVLHCAKRGPWLQALEDLLPERVDAWLEKISLAIAEDVPEHRRPDTLLHPGEPREVGEGAMLSSARGVVWARVAGPAAFVDTQHEVGEGAAWTPLSTRTWLQTLGECRVAVRSSIELMGRGRLFDALVEFHRLFLDTEELNRMLAAVDSANLQRERTALRRREAERAAAELARTVDPKLRPAPDSESELMEVLDAIGRWEGIRFRLPGPAGRGAGKKQSPVSLAEVMDASDIRARRVRLSSRRRWWRGDSGALLAWRAGGGGPVALIPGRFGGYRMVGAGGASIRLDAGRAGLLEDDAWAFCASLPRRATAGDMARLAFRGAGLDILRFFAAGLAAAVLSLAPAFAIRAFVERGLPAQDGGILAGAVLALALLAVAGMGLSLFRAGALLRADGRMAARATAAIWDRLMNVPASGLRHFAAGELAERAFVFQELREGVSGVLAHAVLAGVFLAPALAATWAFNAAVGSVSFVLGLAALAAMTALGLLQIAPHRRAHRARQSLAGSLYEFLYGIRKLRSAGAEESVFAFWAHRYSRLKRAEIEQRRWSEWLQGAAASLPALASALIFAAAAWIDRDLSVADFVAAYAAAMVLFGTIVQLAGAVESIAAAVPACQQVQPLLQALPESADSGGHAELEGEIRFDRVSFRYPGTDTPVLDDVSLHARPGEFIGIVGASGAGKSTLFRLALALDPPTSGTVYFDSHDVTRLNRRSLRGQIGVVFQDATLQPGTVLQNIVGVATDLTAQDAWRAADLAAVARDIREMPMGMYTGVGTGSTFFSGGQIQRLHIAAALVRDPRILLLDEATNWLDTANQAAVMKSIGGIAATRLVIAHRLSTIRGADRIYVLEAGRVAQVGSFRELMATDGPFRRLALRQMDTAPEAE